MSAIVDGRPGDYFVVLSQEQYDIIAEIDSLDTSIDTLAEFTKYGDNYYAKKDAIIGDESNVWISWGIIGSDADLDVEFITLSIQANIFS